MKPSLAQIVAAAVAKRVALPRPRSLAEIVRRAQPQVRPPWLMFASGLKPGQMWGFAELGWGMGFALGPECRARCFRDRMALLERMVEMPGLRVTLLLDSGAIKESGPKGKVITARDWDERMGQYQRVADLLGSGAWLITPDKVGDQKASIERFRRQAPKLKQMVAAGAVLVMALQPGPMSLFDLDRTLTKAIPRVSRRASVMWPVSQIVPAVPMRPAVGGGVTPLPMLIAYLRRRRPVAVHLLGMGPKSRYLRKTLLAIYAAVPSIKVTIDASVVLSVVNPGRAWAVARPGAMADVQADWREGPTSAGQLDFTEASFRMDAAELALVAQRAGAPRQVYDAIGRDPDQFQELEAAEFDEDHPWFGIVYGDALKVQLQAAYLRAQPKFNRGVSQRDRRLVHRIWGDL